MVDSGPVTFLYNHDAAHQVAHSAGLLGALALDPQGLTVVAATGSPRIRAELEKLLSAAQIAAISWHDLSLPSWLDALVAPANRLVPIRRIARLYWHRAKLKRSALIISTERTCLTLKRHWRGHDAIPHFVYIPHGSGDRNVAYHPALRDFDLMLLSGQKLVDQMVANAIVPAEKCRIIGYPKFDALIGRQPDSYFNNNNPVFLYNPHFDPVLSSWYDQGDAILAWFEDHPDYNLIFAPHVMLFLKTMHVSPEYKTGRRRPDVAARYRHVPNILIDLDSPRLFDMSYTLAADVYIGDVSSQVYEFLHRARPVFFLDVHRDARETNGAGGEPAYEFWRNGPVVDSAEQLGALLPDWHAIGERYRTEQQRLMSYTADRSDPRPAAERGAEAIRDYLRDLSMEPRRTPP